MRGRHFFLALESGGWWAARVDGVAVEVRQVEGPTAPSPAEPDVYQLLAAALAELGYQGESVCLGLPSYIVHAARIDCTGLPRRNRYAPMLYRLEEELPVDAESLTADFLPPSSGKSLGLAVRTAVVRALLADLTAVGVEVLTVSATSLLALQDWCRRQSAQPDFVMVGGTEHVDLFRLQDGRPASWDVVAGPAAELVRAMNVDLLSHPQEGDQEDSPSVALLGPFDSDVVGALEAEFPEADVIRDEGSVFEAAARAAARALTDETPAWADFRRGELAPPGLWRRSASLVGSAVVLGLLLLTVLPGLLYWRSMRYADLTWQCRQKEALEYRRLFPNRPLPPAGAVKSRLASDLARLAGVSGAGFQIPERANALETLRRVVANLPAPVRLQVTELRIGPDDVVIEGQTRDHADAQIIARSLSRGALVLDPPRTERLARGGVAFTLMGKVGPEPKPQDGGAKP